MDARPRRRGVEVGAATSFARVLRPGGPAWFELRTTTREGCVCAPG
jgi:hypothetical protein